MRKSLLLVTALVLSGVFASSALAAPVTQTFTASLSPNKLSTKTKPAGVTLTTNLGTRTSDGSKPPSQTNTTVVFPPGFTSGAKAFKTCNKAFLDQNAPEKCASAKVGSGTATIDAGIMNLRNIPAVVTAYNGPTSGGLPTIYFYTVPQVGAATTLVGTLGAQNGSLRLVVPIQLPEAIPGAGRVAITSFNLSTGATAKVKVTVKVKVKKRVKGKIKKVTVKKKVNVKVPFIAAPKTCSAPYQFTGLFTFEDGQNKTVNAPPIACP